MLRRWLTAAGIATVAAALWLSGDLASSLDMHIAGGLLVVAALGVGVASDRWAARILLVASLCAAYPTGRGALSALSGNAPDAAPQVLLAAGMLLAAAASAHWARTEAARTASLLGYAFLVVALAGLWWLFLDGPNGHANFLLADSLVAGGGLLAVVGSVPTPRGWARGRAA